MVQDTLDRPEMINFEKRRKTSEILQQMHSFQKTPFSFLQENQIHNYLLQIQGQTEQNLYEQSCIYEPNDEDVTSQTKNQNSVKSLFKKFGFDFNDV